MINILSYVGMDLQSEVCLWTLLGLLRTIFDATLFKVNANLKQVWQMPMPEELSRPVQRVLRTMISGVILVQCFTLYVYLASYIVLLYPVFLEERPTLVLPWLLLAAIRKLLCELMSLALGLGTCVLLGPARPPCIKFLIVKIASITPAFYMWFLVFSYYHVLKMSTAFKTFTAVLTPSDRDYGLELAVRRRMTKSLQGEDQLRRKLIASLYGERNTSMHMFNAISTPNAKTSTQVSNNSIEDRDISIDVLRLQSVISNRTISDIGTYEDWFGSEVTLPRDTDRILEQFGLMLLRIAVFLEKDETDPVQYFNTSSQAILNKPRMLKCTAVASDDTDTPPHVGSSKGRLASYLTDYPQIFMKKTSDICRHPTSEHELTQVRNTCTSTQLNKDEHNNNVIGNIYSENVLNYDVPPQMKIVELDHRDNQTTPGASHLKESNKEADQCVSNENTVEKNVKCQAVNTDCRLETLEKCCTDNTRINNDILQSAECCKCTRDNTKSRVTENSTSQKGNTKNGKPSPSSSDISKSSTTKGN